MVIPNEDRDKDSDDSETRLMCWSFEVLGSDTIAIDVVHRV